MATDTSKYLFNHTMLRVKDLAASLKYYEFWGMTKVNEEDSTENKTRTAYLAFDSPESVSPNAPLSNRQGVLKLEQAYGTEKDDGFKIANGNSDPGRGFGHICISVDNIQASCKRLEDAGYKFQKKLTDGRMRNIAFCLDPDSYWVEIIGQKDLEKTANEKSTNTGTYRFNHSMVRVKDAKASLSFYQDLFGMTHVDTHEAPQAQFNLYFLGYAGHSNPPSRAHREGLLELTWNYGTEKDPKFNYHNGNTDPVGFSYIGISVDNLEKACARLEEKDVKFHKRFSEGSKNSAIALDPDGYWVHMVQNMG